MPPPGMLPPVLFPGLIRPGVQQQLIPTGGPGILPEPTSQGDTGDKDKPQAGSDKKQESSEDTEAVKGRFSVHVHVHVYRIPDSQVYRLRLYYNYDFPTMWFVINFFLNFTVFIRIIQYNYL